MSERRWEALVVHEVGLEAPWPALVGAAFESPSITGGGAMPPLVLMASSGEQQFGGFTFNTYDRPIQVGTAAGCSMHVRSDSWSLAIDGTVDLDALARVDTRGGYIAEALGDPDRFGLVAVHPTIRRDRDGWSVDSLVLGPKREFSAWIALTR